MRNPSGRSDTGFGEPDKVLFELRLNPHTDSNPGPALAARGRSPSLAGRDRAPGQGGGTPSRDQGLLFGITFVLS